MTRRARKQPTTVEVQIMFEPNREATHVLHQAYTFLLPIGRRRRSLPARTETITAATQNQMGERNVHE